MAALYNVLILQALINRRSLRRRPIYRTREDAFSLPDEVFLEYFRLTKHLVDEICSELSPILLSENTRSNVLSVDVKVLCALRFYATGSKQASVGNEFCLQISQPSASRAVRQVSQAMCRKMFKKWVDFPTEDRQLHELKYQFYRNSDFPGTIGAIDCSHIEILAPPKNDAVYPEHIFLNRHLTHSINVQLVCDAELKILSCNARYPGCSSDSFIWRNSALRDKIQRILKHVPNCWLVGDSDYPLEPWLMVPVTDRVGPSEEHYNNSLKKARNAIVKCFGVLKSRFRCLQQERILHYSPPTAAYITYACVILHNICKFHHLPDLQFEQINDNLSDEADVHNQDIHMAEVKDQKCTIQNSCEQINDDFSYEEPLVQDEDTYVAGVRVQKRIIQNYFT